MNFDLKVPCSECPFLKVQKGYKMKRLRELASGAFPCHKTAKVCEETGVFIATANSQFCVGALAFKMKRGISSNAMRIAYRLSMWNPRSITKKAMDIVR